MKRSTLLILAVFVLLCIGTSAHAADGWADKLSPTAIVAVNDGPVIGGALSYKVYDNLWADLGAKRENAQTNPFFGLSTDLSVASTLLDALLKIDVGDIPVNSRLGGAWDFREGDYFFYFAQGFSF